MYKPRFSNSRRTALAGGAAVLLAGLAASAVKANQIMSSEPVEDVLFIAEGEPTKLKEHRDAWLNAVAAKLGVPAERLEQALQDVAREQGFAPGVPLGPLPPMAPFAGGEVFTLKLDPGIAAAAKALGLTEEALRKEWPAKSFNDIAKGHNVDPKKVADALKVQRVADLDKAVADKRLSATAAERLKSHLDMEIQMLMQRGGFKPGSEPVIHFQRAVQID
jgi:hypothetical protein